MPRCCHAKPPTAGPSAIPLWVPSVAQPKAEPRFASGAVAATYAPIAGWKSDAVRPDRIAQPYSGSVLPVTSAPIGTRFTTALAITASVRVRRVPQASATAPNGRLKSAPRPKRMAAIVPASVSEPPRCWTWSGMATPDAHCPMVKVKVAR